MGEREVGDGWVCSSNGLWLEGVYESQKACRLAYRLSADRLHKLWRTKFNGDGVVPPGVTITEAELRTALMRGQRQ